MQPHQQRVITERDELAEKLTKLIAFIGGSVYNGLPQDERIRLNKQATIMQDYLDVLAERIKSFGVAV